MHKKIIVSLFFISSVAMAYGQEFQDDNLTFRYLEFQPIEFNENRIQGSDPVAANLTAMLAYYVYIILGMDYDSYSLRGGDPYFQKAWNIVNNAPEGRDISGWKQFDGL